MDAKVDRRTVLQAAALGVVGGVAKFACENPPDVSRGLDSHDALFEPVRVGLHWLRVSIPQERLPEAKQKLCVFWGDNPEDREYGLWFYDRSTKWPSGVQLNYHSTEDRNHLTNGRVTIEIPGSALDPFDMGVIALLLRHLADLECEPSRIDVYFDDVERTITPVQLYALVYEESLFEGAPIRHDFTGFRRIRRVVESNAGGRVHDEVDFGTRGAVGGGKYLRVYDKNLETEGENPAIRWELELADERAKKAFQMLLGCWSGEVYCDEIERRIIGVIGSLVGGCIDFKFRGQEKNLERMQRYPFWQLIVDKLGRAVVRAKQTPKTVPTSRRYLLQNLAGTIQMCTKAYGAEEFVGQLVEIATGEDRLRHAHWQALKDFAASMGVPLDIAKLRKNCDAQRIELEGNGL